MTFARDYDSLDFPDYLNGNASSSIELWREAPTRIGGEPPTASTASPAAATEGTFVNHDDPTLARYHVLLQETLGSGLKAAKYPGGRGRDTFRLILEDGRTVIATRRDTPQRALLEARILEILHAGGAPVPKPLVFNGVVLLQEDVAGTRFSDHLLTTVRTDADYTRSMEPLVDSLWEIYRVADRADLSQRTPVIGRTDAWCRAMIDRTALIGHHLGLPCPTPEVQRLEDLFSVIVPEFVKWDARPANALRRADGSACWFDWEHAGARHRLDDLAWLLCDETVPEHPDAEIALIERVLPRYGRWSMAALSLEYLFAFGVSHACVRLARILALKGDGPWNGTDSLVKMDQERVLLREAQMLCRRAARWSSLSRPMRALEPWLKDVLAVLPAGAAETRARPRKRRR